MTLQERAHGIFVDLTVVPAGLGVVADDAPYEDHARVAQQEVEYAIDTILKGLHAAVAEDRERIVERVRDYLSRVPCSPFCSQGHKFHVNYCAQSVANEPGLAGTIRVPE